MSERKDSAAQPENPFTRPWFLASAAMVVIIVILALVYAFLPPVGATPPSSAPTSAASSPATPTTDSDDTGDSVCGLPEGDQTIPGPDLETQWELVGKTAAPAEPESFGPGEVNSEGVRTCFAHNPTGALYATANVLVTGANGRQADTYQYLAAAGPERDSRLSSAAPEQVTDLQVAGFQYISYSEDNAVVTLGVEFPDQTYFTFTTTMIWEDGDWKAVLPPAAGQQVSDLSSLIPWAGV
ncbi:hypothetical protein [Arthrobacter sp. TMS1-12-1]